jgi:DNA-binding NarL/FixJ family response regulator
VNESKREPIRVLIAEDYQIVADGIVKILSEAADIVVVARARDGAEAIRLIERHRPDIALLDLRMPLVDGLGVARWIQSSGSSAQAILLTGFQSERDVGDAIRAGVKAYLLKGTAPGEILSTIRQVHQGERSVASGLARQVEPPLLNPLELKVLKFVVLGCNNQEIATAMGLRTDTVKYRLRGVFSKLGVKKRTAAARKAVELGFIQIEGRDENDRPP